MKTILFLIILDLLPLVAKAYNAKIDGIYYNFNDDKATVTYRDMYYNSYSGTVVIPEFVIYNGTTYNVTSIGSCAFRDCSSLTSITISNSVTSISGCAFSGCSSLVSITIPNSVSSIGSEAFSGCSGLTSITIPNSVTSINVYTFSGCSSLTSITIGNSVTSISQGAFSGCSGLTSITIPRNVTGIGSQAFYGCSGLTSITIPESVTYIGESAFYDCFFMADAFVNNSALTSSNNWGATLCEEETSDGIMINNNCVIKCRPWAISVTIPNIVTSIGDYAFSRCSNLTSITIPNSVTSISSNAFSNCYSLKKTIWLPNTPPSGYNKVSGAINYVANEQYTSLSNKVVYPFLSSMFEVDGIKYVPVNPSERTCDAIDCLYDESVAKTNIGPTVSYKGITMNVQKIQPYLCYNNKFIESLYCENNGDIREYAFCKCTGITSVKCNNGGNIGYNAFSGCTGITSVVCNNNGNIDENAFSGCSNITSVDCNNGGYIGQYAFQGCTSITSVKCINGGYIGNNAFSGCTGIISVKCDNNGDIKQNAFYGCTSITSLECNNGGDIGQYAFSGCTSIAKAICNNNGAIGNNAFSGCIIITDLTLGEEVSSIGSYAFQNCSSLSSVIIPNSVTSIGEYSFSGCSLLDNLVLGNQVKTIGQYAFSGCKSVPAISIPASVTTINNYAFKGCTGLMTLIIANRENSISLGSNDKSPLFSDCPLDSVYIGGKLSYSIDSYYGYSPFYRNTALRTVVITDKETEISPNEFYGCTNLQNFTIGDGVKSFGDWAFSGCSSLKSLSFGSQLSSIGKEAFSDCISVTKIVSKAVTPPSCGNQALDDINKWECTLYVPEGSLTAYQGAEQWKQFFFITEGTDPDVEPGIEPEEKKCATPTISYTNGKLTFNCETEGAICQSSIKDTDIKSYSGNEVQLGVTYTITVYATKAGYENSEVATGTLCWIDVAPQSEGIVNEDAVMEVKAMPVLIQSQGGTISIQGAAEGTPIAIYGIDGKEYGSATSEKDRTTIATSLRPGSIAIVKIGEKAVKVMIKE